MKKPITKTVELLAICWTGLFAFSGCSTIRPERIPGTPVVAAASVAAYPVMLIGATQAGLYYGDTETAGKMLAFPYWFTRDYLTGGLE